MDSYSSACVSKYSFHSEWFCVRCTINLSEHRKLLPHTRPPSPRRRSLCQCTILSKRMLIRLNAMRRYIAVSIGSNYFLTILLAYTATVTANAAVFALRCALMHHDNVSHTL